MARTDIQFTPRERITKSTWWLMGLSALAADGIQFVTKALHLIPVIGNMAAIMIGIVVSAAVGFSLWMWLSFNDVSLMDGSVTKIAVQGATVVVEATPFINALPGWTLYVILIGIIVRSEDTLYNIQQRRTVQNITRRAQKTD